MNRSLKSALHVVRTRLRARGSRNERGSAAVFVVGMAVTLFACAGLVLDAGTALNARMRLADQVEQAARAGAQQIDVLALRQDQVVVLDQQAAESAARSYMANVSPENALVEVAGDQVTVTAKGEVKTVLLSIIGIDKFSIRARATSEAVTR